MLKNFLASAFKNLLGDRVYSVINIVGLAFGLAGTILIALYVLDETSYDKQWTNAERIYRVNTSTNPNGDGFSRSAGTALPVLPALQRYFPQEIEAGSRLMPFDSVIELGSRRFEERVYRVDAGFLDMFGMETLAGNLDDALSEPGKIALRADLVQRVFSDVDSAADILGQVLHISYNGVGRDYQVVAVYRLPPGNTILDLPMLTLLDESVMPGFYNAWGARTLTSYIQLRPGVAVNTLSADLGAFADDNVDTTDLPAGAKPSDRMRFDLQNIGDLHLDSSFDEGSAGGNRTVVMAFTAIAVLVLLIATINYTILSTARATLRAREATLRKTVGASRLELIGQFLIESFCVVLPALLISCGLVELLLPVFEAMVGKTLAIQWLSNGTLLGMTLVYLIVSILGGLYPALVLSRFRPADNLKAAQPGDGKGSLNLRNLLVVFQFGVSIALIIATGVIYAQVRYAMARDPGFNRENVLVIDNLATRAEVNAGKETLKLQLSNLSAVTGATLSSHQPTQTVGLANITSRYSIPGEGGVAEAITTLGIDYDFFSTYQTQIVAGRDFSMALDQPAEIFPQQAGGPAPSKVIINVSAARRLGFASPAAAVGKQIRFTNPVLNRESHDLTVIGVAADTNFYSMNAVPRAEIYSLSPGFTDVLSLRFEGNPQEVLAQVGEVWRSVMGDAEFSSSFVAQNMADEFAQERIEAQLLVGFSLLAIVIASLGLYGSSAFSITRRTKEIGIRKVMGAEIRQILAMLLWQFSRPVLFANALAWPLASWAMLTWLQRFPYRIDALVLIPVCVLAGAIALSIAWLTVAGNTLKVAGTNPVYALRYE